MTARLMANRVAKEQKWAIRIRMSHTPSTG
jgi:hypothetical protein